MIEKKIKQIKNKYRKKTKIQCPAFDNEALILGADFWKHLLLQKNKRLRTVEDMNGRLNAVDKMVEIVENTFYYQDFYRGKEKSKIIYYWTILAVINDIRYGVIIRKKGKQGNKHIYSIIPNFRGIIPRSDRDKIKTN
jgi:hypothetical protein